MRRTLVTGMLLTLLLAGCGGDSDDAEPAAGPTTTTTAAAATPGSIDTNFTGQGGERFCEVARTVQQRLAKLPQANPTELRSLATETEAAIRELQAVVPPEIKGDAQVVFGASIAFFQELARVDYDATKLTPEALAVTQRPEVQASGQRLEAYSQKVCGLSTTTTAAP